MEMLINSMQICFDFKNVEIFHIKDTLIDYYYFVDKFDKKVVVHCKNYKTDDQAIRHVFDKITFYLKNNWVETI